MPVRDHSPIIDGRVHRAAPVADRSSCDGTIERPCGCGWCRSSPFRLWIINIPETIGSGGRKTSVILPLISLVWARIAAVQQRGTPFWRLMRKRCRALDAVMASCSATLSEASRATCRWAT